MTVFTFAFVLASIVSCTFSQEEPKCPYGQYTKEAPSPESGMKACKEYACDSCCTAEITEELAKIPLQVVGGMNYSQCGGLSQICSQYMAYTQCFYQCSPNVYPWLGPQRRLNNLPLCGSFCDEWFNACKADRSCVQGTDWARGFDVVPDPDNPKKYVTQCRKGQSCRNFTQIYGTSQDFCNEMYPGTVVYTSNEEQCINPAGGASTANEAYFKTVAGTDATYTVCETVTYIDTGAIIGIVIGCLAGLALICGAIMFFLRNKQNKSKKPKKPEGKPKEMEELNPTTLE